MSQHNPSQSSQSSSPQAGKSSSGRAPFTWHYYFMAFGILMALLAATLSAWGSALSAVGFAVVFLPNFLFKLHTRVFFAVAFSALYIMGFPPAETVIQMMSVTK